MLEQFLNKRCKVVRKGNNFIFIGTIKEVSPLGILIDDERAGLKFLSVSEIGEIHEWELFR